jgi:enolase
MAKIKTICGREIYDSRGNPTVEVEVYLENNIMGRAQVPSGASTGRFEAVELRDGNAHRLSGMGVLKAVENINTTIAENLIGHSALEQATIDKVLISLDGTQDKSKLGANALLGVSMACAKAAAQTLNLPLYRYLGNFLSRTLPVPLINILNGGRHAENNVDIQEFMIVPLGASTFRQAMEMGAQTFHALKKILVEKGLACGIGDEGGFAPNLKSNELALDLLLQAIERAKYKAGDEIAIALDVAASGMYKDGKYVFSKSDGRICDGSELVSFYQSLTQKYPIISLEDPMDEEDWEGWRQLTCALDKKIQLVGDDIFVTNIDRFLRGVEQDVANAILIKLNQIGTVSESFECIEAAHRSGYSTVISHRSGETEDTIIAHVAVASNSGQIKTGSICRSERVAKYNELLRIEESLADQGIFMGRHAF